MTQPRPAAMAFIYVTALLDMLAFGLVIPVLPFLIEQLAGGGTGRAAEIAGIFGLVFAGLQFFAGPVLGALSDRFGRRPVILLSNLGLGLDYVLMALAPNLGWLFVGRAISGVTAASFAICSAYIADTAPPDKRAAGFGMLGALFGFGFIAGPLLGGVLGQSDPRLPFWVAGGLSLLNALYGFFVLPESLPPERRAAFSWKNANPVGSLGLLRSHPLLLGLAGVALLNNLGHDVNPQVFVFYTHARYGWNEAAVGTTLMVFGIFAMIVQGALVGPIVARFGERRALLAGLACGAIGFSLQAWAPTPLWFRLAIPIVSLWGIYGAALQGLMVQHVDAAQQGRLQGALHSLRGLCALFTPVLYTQVFARFADPGHGPPRLAGAPYWLATGLVAGAFVLALRVVGRAPQPAGA